MRHAQVNNRDRLGGILRAMVWEINRSLGNHNPRVLYMVATKWEAILREVRTGHFGDGICRR